MENREPMSKSFNMTRRERKWRSVVYCELSRLLLKQRGFFLCAVNYNVKSKWLGSLLQESVDKMYMYKAACFKTQVPCNGQRGRKHHDGIDEHEWNQAKNYKRDLQNWPWKANFPKHNPKQDKVQRLQHFLIFGNLKLKKQEVLEFLTRSGSLCGEKNTEVTHA